MNPSRKQFMMTIVNMMMVIAVVFNLILPTVQAQDATDQPTPAPATDTPTDVPTATQAPTDVPTDTATTPPTDAPTDTPTSAATDTVTAQPTEATTAEPTAQDTSTPTPAPTQPPTISVFQDDFQDGKTDGWTLTPGWQLGVEGDNLFLTTSNPNESATIANLSLDDFSFAARLRIADGNQVNVTIRSGAESDVVTLDSLGNVLLSRGANVLAQGGVMPTASAPTTPVWHTLNIQAIGGLITVNVDGTQQIAYNDPAPLPAGGITISSDAANTGAVSVDQVVVGQPVLTTATPIIIPTEEPTVAVPTEEVTAEPTEEATVEATQEATTEATQEATIEATSEATATATPGQVVLSANFEGDLIGWTAGDGTSVVADTDSNHALLMAAGSTFIPSDALNLGDFQLDARLNIVSDSGDGSPSGVSFAFHSQNGQSYSVSVEAGQTVLYRNDGTGLAPLATSLTPHALNAWHTLSVNDAAGHIVVTVDDVAEIDATDAQPLPSGGIAFLANNASSVMLDDIVVTDFGGAVAQAEATAALAQTSLTAEQRAKLNDVLGSVVEAYLSGDQAGALEQAKANFLPMDDQGRVSVMVWGAKGETGKTIAPIVQALGGQVDFTNDASVQAHVPLNAFVALVSTPQIFWVDITSQAVSTGNLQAPPQKPQDAPAGTAVSEGFDVIGANDWHTAKFTGAGVKIGIIDTGFVGVTGKTGEWTCLSGGNPDAGGTTSTHGNMVLQVVCDIAPSAAVTLYQATDASSLASKIGVADNTNDIILIAMDLGVDAAPGDGTDGGVSGTSVYDAIQTARTAGKLVVVSAGNNNGRQVNFQYAGSGSTNVSITANAGDHINVEWNDWGGTDALTLQLAGSGVTTQTYSGPRAGSAPPSHQFTIPAQGSCDVAPATLCSLTLSVTGGPAHYVQVQATGVGAVNSPTGTGFSNVNTTSTIGRPGDSPYALTVGAVCKRQQSTDVDYPSLADSSHGPIFGAGGGAPSAVVPTTRTGFKPDLAGPSDVTTSFADAIGLTCDGSDGGFTGTSAAAAHVAAMAALIRSDSNIGATTPQAIIDYLQSHSIDTFSGITGATKPNGFDMATGSGLAVLGNPVPDANHPIAVDPSTLSAGNVTCPTGGAIHYVSPYNLSSPERNLSSLGGFTNPYISPAQALANSAANDCVVLLPGEYVSGIFAIDSTVANNTGLYSFVSFTPGAQNSSFWVNPLTTAGSGIEIGSQNFTMTRNFTVNGFQFLPAKPLLASAPSAIVIASSSGNVTIDNSTLNGFFSSALSINSSDAVTVQNSTFSQDDVLGGAIIQIVHSGTTTPILLQYNTFSNNIFSGVSVHQGSYTPIINVTSDPQSHIGSSANIYNNRFLDNFIGTNVRSDTTIIAVSNLDDSANTPFTGAHLVQVIGNAIFDNGNGGPIVDLKPSRKFRFTNNTVANQTFMNDATPVIHRGDYDAGGNPPADDSDGETAIDNNLFYNNGPSSVTGAQAIFDDPGKQTNCYDLSGNADAGMKNNWSWQSGSVTADCINALQAFNNAVINNGDESIPQRDPTSSFVFNAIPLTAPDKYDDPYQLVGTSFGVDYGDNTLLPGGTITTDVLKKPRISGTKIDVGAYEFKIVTGTDFTKSVVEDSPSVVIRMNDYVQGGFAPYSFQILSFPLNYDTNSTNACGGQPLALTFNSTTKETDAIYCPPPNFYNNSPAPAEAAVNFTYQVTDKSGTISSPPNTGTITVTAVADTPLSGSVPTYTVLTQVSTPITFRVRPYAKFQNFRFSEQNNTVNALNTMADYPFTYSNPAITSAGDGSENPSLFDQSDLNTAFSSISSSGQITLTPNAGEVGYREFSYTIKDVHGSSATGHVRIQVVGTIPDSGLHDDASLEFNYHGLNPTDPGQWTPTYSEVNINNTLHVSKTMNDTAEFLMTGSGFALYMQGSTAGGNWELQIDNGGNPVVFGGTPAESWTFNAATGRYNATSQGVTCTTSGTTATGALISNKTAATYVVSCSGLLEDQANTVRIINRQNLTVSIDAIGIIRDSSPLLRGFHEVTEAQMQPIFFGWNLLTDVKASGQRAMVTTNPNVPDLSFTFKGTGFALGTVLEKYAKVTTGTTYSICVAPTATPTNKMCQNFDNSLGASSAPIYNVFRPFFGFDPTVTYNVTVHVTNMPTGGRMYIDSIVVFDKAPTAVLPIGTTEDSQLGPIVFAGGLEDTWTLDTNNTKASSNSLTSVTSATKAGPFFSFRIPDAADTINWYRVAGTTDSNYILVCVDRASGLAAGTQATNCVTRDLKTAGNPVVIKKTDFNNGAGWGAAWGSPSAHTVEIFSLTNQPFNVDKIQVINSAGELVSGSYEENAAGIRYFTESGGVYTLRPTGDSGNFVDVTNASASGGKYKSVVAPGGLNEGMFFQFNGTGFSTYFVLDKKADAVRICYLNNIFGGAPDGGSVNTVLTTGTCQTYDNESAATRYKAARTIVGLPFGDYSVVVQMLNDQGEPVVHAAAATPITMDIDSVQIYSTNPLPPNVLTAVGTRYETSFVNQTTNGQFAYYGTGWKSVSGTAAKLYSGSNYDSIVNVIGAGIMFRTDGTSSGADSVIIYRDTRAGYAPMQVCIDGATSCVIISNAGGTGNQQPIVVPLGDSNPHTVSITTTDFGTFNLDAIALGNNGALTPGLYDENDPAITYSNTAVPQHPVKSQWADIALASYLSGGAMQSNTAASSMSFSFTGTGFSLITLFDASSSSVLNVAITGANPYNTTFNSNNAATVYGAAHSFTGLPSGTYNVTITEADPGTKHRFTVDGLEIYGNPPTAMATGIYDDAATDTNNLPLIAYGPSNTTWTAKAGTATGYMNLSNHLASRYGAHIDFQVTGAGYITLFDTGSTSLSLRVCARSTATTTAPVCGTTSPSGHANTTISLNGGPADVSLSVGGPGNYVISVTNLSQAKSFYLDAIGVYGSAAPLTAGLYQENNPLLTSAFMGTWTNAVEATATDKNVKSTTTGSMSFQFTGTGFSIVLVESTTTSQNYTVNVSSGVNQSLSPVGATSAKRPVALTYVGFTSGTYTVTLTNNDSTKPLEVDRVDVLGTLSGSQQIASTFMGNVEDTDARLTYFPYFSFNPVTAVGPSGGSQHISTMQGSIVYFELATFAGDSINYIRQTLASYGTAAVCFGAIGTNSSGCTPFSIANNVAPFGYQQGASAAITTGSTQWVAIRNTDGKTMPVDVIQPKGSNILNVGSFEETQPSMKYMHSDGSPATFTPVTNAAASGGATLSTTTVGDAMLFEFNGSGFGVRFTLDNKADAVKICWVNSLTTTLSTVLAGTCQTFDNQSATPRYQAERTFQFVNTANYTVAVQMQADNGVPAVHAASALPITMQIDGVRVYDTTSTLPAHILNPLNPVGTRYEPSFANAATDQNFLYFGSGWKSVSGTAAKLYSGSNYDTITNVIGAGVMFRTTGANALLLYRDTRAGFAPIQVCSYALPDPTKRYCTTIINTTPTSNQQPARVFLNDPSQPGGAPGQFDSTTQHIVTITTLDAGTFNLDAIQVISATSTDKLGPGFYEDVYPTLNYTNPNLTAGETAWAPVYASGYTGGRVMQTQDNDAQMTFQIIAATGFEIGTAMDRYGGEVEVCYNSADDLTFAAGPATKCFTYEDEQAALNTTVSRTVTGLDTGTIYAVRLRNVEDGTSIITHTARVAPYTPSRLRVDYVQVYGTALPPVTPAGYYDENAVDGTGTPYLQLLPTNRWFTFTGTTQKAYSFSTDSAVVGATNVASSTYAGPVATLRVAVPSGAGLAGTATVVLYTGTAVSTATGRLLVCANNVDGTDSAPGPDCTIITNLKTSNQIVLNSSVLSALGASSTTVTLSFRALTPGLFRIDGFEVISGNTLVPGIYDDSLFSNTGVIATSADFSSAAKWTLAPTTGTKFTTAFGGSVALAQSTAATTDDPTLTFNINGTGFSIITQADAVGVDFRVCYKLTTTATAFPASTVLFQTGNVNSGAVICDTRTTDTTSANWKALNGAEPLLGTAAQYGFAYDGLKNNNYTVEVRLVDTTLAATDRLKIDAIGVFGDVTGGTPLTPGTLYDNTQAGLVLSPSFYWIQTVATATPTKGPWNKTETSTTTAGAIAQMYVQGNSVILYQTVKSTGSRYVLVCLSTAAGQECSQFSQNVSKTTYFTPIMFYGLGTSGAHEVILENRDPGKSLSIDAIRILP